MDSNTFYYTVSTIPQVIVAITAVVATICFFRIANLNEYLIGDGSSLLSRWNHPGYSFPDTHENRLKHDRVRDAVSRRNIYEIKEVLYQLSILESEKGITIQQSPTGLQYVFNRFCHTETRINRIKVWNALVVASCFVTIIVSIIFLALTDTIKQACNLEWFLWIDIGLFIISQSFALFLGYICVFKRSLHESDRRTY